MPDHVVGAVPCRTGRGDAGMNHDETNGPLQTRPTRHFYRQLWLGLFVETKRGEDCDCFAGQASQLYFVYLVSSLLNVIKEEK